MTKEERLKLYEKATQMWGERAQIDQIIEEMAELTVALHKYKRLTFYNEQRDKEALFENLFIELADVSICLEQMIHMFGEEKTEQAKESQLNRFQKQIEKFSIYK
jgi:hypothetical protein